MLTTRGHPLPTAQHAAAAVYVVMGQKYIWPTSLLVLPEYLLYHKCTPYYSIYEAKMYVLAEVFVLVLPPVMVHQVHIMIFWAMPFKALLWYYEMFN